jgi:hypothetical protein
MPAAADARADDGREYLASISCPAHPGEAVRAPEPGTVTRACAPRPWVAHVGLLADSGRCWVFVGAAPRGGTGHVAAGAEIGRVVRRDVGIELWESERGGRRLSNLWNPMLFLPISPSGLLGYRARVPAYPGDNAPPTQIARWMGTAAEAAGLPPELPVMTALVTSGLHNLNYGDRDSVGFFAMRLGVWNVGAYKGFAHNPAIQMKWFIDLADSVRRQRSVDPAGHPECYGDWAADVIRPAAQYRGRFQLRLQEARALLGLPPTHVGRSRSCNDTTASIPGAAGRGGS